MGMQRVLRGNLTENNTLTARLYGNMNAKQYVGSARLSFSTFRLPRWSPEGDPVSRAGPCAREGPLWDREPNDEISSSNSNLEIWT